MESICAPRTPPVLGLKRPAQRARHHWELIYPIEIITNRFWVPATWKQDSRPPQRSHHRLCFWRWVA
jgi:hypothetical protein